MNQPKLKKPASLFSVLIFFGLIMGFAQLATAQTAYTTFDQAVERSQQEDKRIMLVFSGSDWCKPCILLKREIISAPEFKEFSDENLVLLNLDFPYRSKNKLPRDQGKHNDALADLYNPDGKFPSIILLDKDKSMLKTIIYQHGMTPTEFIEIVKQSI